MIFKLKRVDGNEWKILTVKVALVDYYIIAHKHTCLVFQW